MVDYIERDFAGMATADDAVNLAFKISGQILSVDVSKGDYVKKGELLARLDPRDVELQKAADRQGLSMCRLNRLMGTQRIYSPKPISELHLAELSSVHTSIPTSECNRDRRYFVWSIQ